MAADYSPFVTSGLQGAKDAIAANTYQAYPAYTGGNKANPYAQQQQAAGMQGTGFTPAQAQYNGIGQSADQIRADYAAPVTQAYQQAQTNIANKFGANGLYGSLGSGLMSGAIGDATSNYATNLAQANSLANQAIMTNDMNRVNSTLDANELYGNQQLDAWKAGLQTTDYNNQLVGSNAQWGNDQIDAAYADQLARRSDQQAYNQSKIENYLGLAGGGTPAYSSQLSANAQQSAASAAAKAANTSSYVGAAGSLLGGLLSGAGNAGGFGNLFSWD